MSEKSLTRWPGTGWSVPCSLTSRTGPHRRRQKREALPLDESFKLALREALECADTDSSRLVLNGVCLDIRNKEAHYVVGSDGTHLYAANSFLFDIPASLTLPTRCFLEWLGFASDGPWRLRFYPEAGDKTGLFSLESDHWSYVARPVPGDTPSGSMWCRKKAIAPGSTWRLGVETILDALPLLPRNGPPLYACHARSG